MVISLKQLVRPIAGAIILAGFVLIFMLVPGNKENKFVMGGFLHSKKIEPEASVPVSQLNDPTDYSERFQRPSKIPAVKLKYMVKDFIHVLGEPQNKYIVFESPTDVIQAFYSVLKEASNMGEHVGGCGTIGWTGEPYPYAYEFLSKETKGKMSLEKFKDSFSGIGHITLLKLYPAYKPPGTPESIKYYFVEIEVITGPIYNEDEKKVLPSYFAYYYGLITTEYLPLEGWKIKAIDYVPEDFLCAPYHHWYWDARGVTGIIHTNWYGLINAIEEIEMKDSLISIYAVGGQGKYRFDFVRLTNGEDILLHEYQEQNGRWMEMNFIKVEHQFYKFSVLNPILHMGIKFLNRSVNWIIYIQIQVIG